MRHIVHTPSDALIGGDIHTYLKGSAVLLSALALIVFVTVLVFRPHHNRGKCVQFVAGSTELWACQDGRAYSVPGWHDAGPLTPVPGLPK